MLSAGDHKRIADAIGSAESKTRGEIFCVLAHEVSHYREVPLAWAAFVALAVPPLAALAGLNRLWLQESWSDKVSESLVAQALSSYALVQAFLFLLVAVIVAQPKIRRLLTPRFLKRHRVRQVARHHFVASGARLSDADPHILIYASLADRQVELVAHEAIHKAVGDSVWQAAVAAVTEGMKRSHPADGFVSAIEICGQALAAHFPGTGENRLPNDILER